MGGISCLTLLNWVVLLCCMVSYMLRVNLAITIVVMPDTNAYNAAVAKNVCSINSTLCPTNSTKVNETSYKYDSWTQNMIHSSFFWGYVLSEIPGGRLGEVIGPRKVIGFSIFLASVLNILIPVTSDYIGYPGILVVRLLQGLALGVVFPSLYPLAAKWVPPMDRGKFMSNLLALSLGAAFTYPLCGFLIEELGWRSVFYTTGALGLLWTVGWFIFVYDSPASHPRISPKEKLRLESLIGTSASNKVYRVPWKKIITSGPVWAVVITHTCVFTNYSTLSIQLPTFIHDVFKINIKKIGFYSSLPHLGKYIVGVLTGYVAAYLMTKGKLSTINTRRIFLLISTGIPGILMLVQAHTGYMIGWTIFNVSLSLTLNGAVTGGHLCGGLDIAPNFSGTIFGMANTLGSMGSLLSVYFVGHMTANEQTFKQWRPMFWMLGGTYMVSLITYLTLGSAKLQDWNMPKLKAKNHKVSFDGKLSELKPINEITHVSCKEEEDC